MTAGGVFVIGGAQSDFGRNLLREGLEVSHLVSETVTGTLCDAGVAPEQIGSVHVANAFGQLFTGQGHLGAMPATVIPELWGVPAMRHEAACASGSIAVLAATAELEAGRYDCVLVLGVEQERNVAGDVAARHLAAAAFAGHESEDAKFLWPAQFIDLADEYQRRYGLDEQHLRAIAAKNYRNARSNPFAQTRSWDLDPRRFTADDEANPRVEGRLRRSDCSQITDGAAGVVLVSERWLERNPRPAARLLGWGHRTVGLPLAPKLARSRGGPYVMPHVRDASGDALRRAGVADVSGLDAIETHDCFTPSEYLAIDHFGITAPGESWKAVESGEIERDGRIPVNPSGGLIGGGHPVGATGVRMLLDAARQVTAQAGGCQVEGAERVATLNIGGSTATTVCLVVGAEPGRAS